MRWWLTSLLGVVACASGPHELRVDLRTDLVPGAEFDTILVAFDGEPARELTPGEADYVIGARVLDTLAKPGEHVVEVSLTRNESTVLERAVHVRLDADYGITVVLTRDCRGVVCPGEDASATQCLGGRCVVPECAPETPEACGAAECTTAADCSSAATCGAVQCNAGTCLYASDSSSCRAGAYCDPDAGCRDPSVVWGVGLAATDDVVVLGYSIEGPARVGDRDHEPIGASDMYLEGRSADGSTILWSRDLQTGNHEWPDAMRITPDGRLLMAGVTKAPELFADDGFIFPEVESHDVFVAMLDPTNGAVEWAIPVVSDENGLDVVGLGADETGRVAAVFMAYTGRVGDISFPESDPPVPHLVMLDSTGTPLWSLPTDDDFEVHAVETRGGTTYVIGCTHGEIVIDGVTAPATGKDALIARIDDVSGTPEVVWLQLLDAEQNIGFHDGVLDDAGILHVVADYDSPATGFGLELADPPASRWQGLVMGIDATGTATYSISVGGDEVDRINSIEHRAGTLLVGGTSVGQFDVGPVNMMESGRRGFLLEMDTLGVPMRIESVGSGSLEALDVALSATTRCALGDARARTEPPFFRGRVDTLYFGCAPR